VTITPPNTGGIFGEENTVTEVEVSLALKTLKTWRLQAVIESDLKCSMPWFKEFFGWLVRVGSQVFWKITESLANWGDVLHTPVFFNLLCNATHCSSSL